MKDLNESFLHLVRLGIGTSKDACIPKSLDWFQMKTIADEQGLSAIVLDGLDKLNTNQTNSTNLLPLEFKLEWIGEVLQEYEQRYELYKKSIGSLAGFYNQHGYKMMVLKGYACSLDWPKPEHRPCGDIDIWQFGQQEEADSVLLKEKGIKIDNSHHHHTVFNWGDFSVENHYDFINVHHHKSHVALEKLLKELGADDSFHIDVYGEKVYLPSPNLHALFLLKHAALHFVGTELTFRQVLDWAFFVEKHSKDIDWKWLLEVVEDNGLMPFLQIINAICVEDLGFEAEIFFMNQHCPEIKEKVLNEIYAYVYKGESSNIIKRQVQRFSKWKKNEWKHELCFKDSMWSSFWNGLWGHLLKPQSL